MTVPPGPRAFWRLVLSLSRRPGEVAKEQLTGLVRGVTRPRTGYSERLPLDPPSGLGQWCVSFANSLCYVLVRSWLIGPDLKCKRMETEAWRHGVVVR